MKVGLIIAFRNFRDEEYFLPKNVLENAGIKTLTISIKPGIAIGSRGGEARVDILIKDLNVEEFDGIIFIGGSGALAHLDNEKSYEIIRAVTEKNKVLGAICISPAILAKSKALRDKRATVWSSPLDRSAIKILKDNGVFYKDESVVVDGKIVTSNGPLAAQEFGQKLVEVLK